jgi:hypothetical protein
MKTNLTRYACVVALTGLITGTFPVLPPAIGNLARAQTPSATSPSTSKGQAATLLNQVQVALEAMRQEFGSAVFIDGQGDLSSSAHGSETIGEAWNRNLTAAGVPKQFSQREALARSIGLDPQASLALVGPAARMDAIEYLLSQLRHISEDP